MTRYRSLAKKLGLALGVLALLIVILYLVRFPILRGVGAMLTHVDPITHSDAIVVLSGAEDTRPFYAAELYGQGIASAVVIAKEEPTPTARLGLTPSDTDVAIQVLIRSGVPDSAVQLIGADQPVTSTREEAVAIRDYIVRNAIDTVTVVTSPFHTARARYTLRRTFEGLPVTVFMAAAPEWLYDPERWWENETGISSYGMEILKWVYTLKVLE